MNRELIIKQCIKAKACRGEFCKLVASKHHEGFNHILSNNIGWVINHNIDVDFKEIISTCNLNGCNWSYLLSEYPKFYKSCNWKSLDEDDWDLLLEKQPQFSKYKI